MVEMFFRLEEVHVVGGDERNAEFVAKALGFAQRSAVAGREMLNFDIKAIGEDIFQLRERGRQSSTICVFVCRGTMYRAPTVARIRRSRWQWAQRNDATAVLGQSLKGDGAAVGFRGSAVLYRRARGRLPDR